MLSDRFDPIITIRCKNYDAEPEVCHVNCGVEVTRAEYEEGDWIDVVLGTHPEWFVVLRACHDHGRHEDAYCSLTCFQHVHATHAHPSNGGA